MNKLNSFLSTIDGYIGGSQWFVLLLLGTGIFFTIYLKFPQFRYLKYSLRIVRGKFDKEGDIGDTSHFQADDGTFRNGWHGEHCRGGTGYSSWRAGSFILDADDRSSWNDD